MKRKNSTAILCLIGVMVIIFDSACAFGAAKDGVRLCLEVVIPSLFPFFVLTGPITAYFCGKSISPAIARFLKIPSGSEGILLTGILGGYPMGVKSVRNAYDAGALRKTDAKRMLMFCNFAGPSFLFGMVGNLFGRKSIVWALWAVHILSALLIAGIIPGSPTEKAEIPAVSVKNVILQAVSAMAVVCAWVILFRVILAFCGRWFLWRIGAAGQAFFGGILELSNGILMLHSVGSLGCKFVLSAIMLGFGGICVAMQASFFAGNLGAKTYLLGKVLHGLYSGIFAYFLQLVLFGAQDQWHSPAVFGILGVTALTFSVISAKKAGYSAPIPV